MFDHSYFLMGVIGIITSLLTVYMWVVIVAVVISWINPDPYNPIVRFLRAVTEPALARMRRYVPDVLWSTGLDFTPLFLILLIQLVIWFLRSLRL